MNFRKGRNREDPEINLIPFIDVLLVILIFLMITTTYTKFTALEINLPTADAEKAMDRPSEITVSIDARGRYAVNNVPVAFRDVDSLAVNLKEAHAASGSKPDPVIIISADAMAAHQLVINAMEAAQRANMPKISFISQTGGSK